jgi:hypothetical protein
MISTSTGSFIAGLSLTWRSMPRPAPEMQCRVPPAFQNFGILSERKISAQGKKPKPAA